MVCQTATCSTEYIITKYCWLLILWGNETEVYMCSNPECRTRLNDYFVHTVTPWMTITVPPTAMLSNNIAVSVTWMGLSTLVNTCQQTTSLVYTLMQGHKRSYITANRVWFGAALSSAFIWTIVWFPHVDQSLSLRDGHIDSYDWPSRWAHAYMPTWSSCSFSIEYYCLGATCR